MTVNEAQKQGVEAYRAGMGRAPALNPAFTNQALASGRFCKMADAYINGWDVANLADGAPADAPSVASLALILAP